MTNPKLCLLGRTVRGGWRVAGGGWRVAGGGKKTAPFLRQVLPDRAFDAMMLMGARSQKKILV
jgi:hypothetical protein